MRRSRRSTGVARKAAGTPELRFADGGRDVNARRARVAGNRARRAGETRPAPGRAKKGLGQHFLERAWADKVVRAIAPADGESFLEIGPGRGALTRPLAARARRVVAFELDRDLAAQLRENPPPNVKVVEGDFLAVTADRLRTELEPRDTSQPRDETFRVAGNLPYNVASPILFKLVELHDAGLRLADATLMFQREVAERLLAAPGSRDYGVLSILIRHRASVQRLLALPPGAFRPAPRVHSLLVRLRFHPPDPPPRDPGAFIALTRAIFTRRRKTLANALLAYPVRPAPPAEVLARAAIDGRRRPETLNIGELVRLSDVFAEWGRGG